MSLMTKMKYIDGKEQLGIDYDWKLIIKEFEKLKIPKNVYSPVPALKNNCKYYVSVSERSTGKTTNWILLGLVMNKLYGTQIQYVRQSEAMILPKNIGQMMSVINSFGYVEKLTDGKYNMLRYKNRHWRYARTGEDGEVLEESDSVMFCMDLDHNETLKSSYNSPRGDLIIFDEFIAQRYRLNEFVTFCDLVKTIIRDRLSPIIVMLANTTDRYNTYFQELDIQQEILGCKIGESFRKNIGGSTPLYCELVGNKNEARAHLNSLFFKFKNPRLASITGGDWAIDSYPHIQKEDCIVLLKNRVISYNNALVGLEVCHNDRLGNFVKAHRINKLHDESIVYQLDEITHWKQRRRFGHTKLDGYVWTLYQRGKWYYSTNEVGNIVDSFIRQARQNA